MKSVAARCIRRLRSHQMYILTTLAGYPPHWLDSAIPYGELKKCLKKVQKELLDMGLDPETMRQLLQAQMTSSEGGSVPLAKYDFDGEHPLVACPCSCLRGSLDSPWYAQYSWWYPCPPSASHHHRLSQGWRGCGCIAFKVDKGLPGEAGRVAKPSGRTA